jgi:hypothetical protein
MAEKKTVGKHSFFYVKTTHAGNPWKALKQLETLIIKIIK